MKPEREKGNVEINPRRANAPIPREITKHLTPLQTKMLKSLDVNMGIVSRAAENIGISRCVHYKWYRTIPAYKEYYDLIQERVVDFAEGELYKQIASGEVASTIFFLKTKGKSRGYVEKTETEISGNLGIKWVEEKTYEQPLIEDAEVISENETKTDDEVDGQANQGS